MSKSTKAVKSTANSTNAVTDTAASSKKAAVPQVPFQSAHLAPLLENLVSELFTHQSAADFNDDLNELFSDALASEPFQDCGATYARDKFYTIRLLSKFFTNAEALQYRAMIPHFDSGLRHDALAISSNL